MRHRHPAPRPARQRLQPAQQVVLVPARLVDRVLDLVDGAGPVHPRFESGGLRPVEFARRPIGGRHDLVTTGTHSWTLG